MNRLLFASTSVETRLTSECTMSPCGAERVRNTNCIVASAILGAVLASAMPVSASAQQQQNLWSYGVPGATVKIYEQRCNSQEANKFRGQGTVRFVNRPGRVWGSNDVACILTRNAPPQQPQQQMAIVNGRSVPLSSLRHDGRNVYMGGQVVGAVGSGGRLVASGGGNLVASGGGNLVASGGGNIVSTGSGSFR